MAGGGRLALRQHACTLWQAQHGCSLYAGGHDYCSICYHLEQTAVAASCKQCGSFMQAMWQLHASDVAASCKPRHV
jgi:hypothetical protein